MRRRGIGASRSRDLLLSLGLLLAGCTLAPIPPEALEVARERAVQRGDWMPYLRKEEEIRGELLSRFVSEEGLYAYRLPVEEGAPPLAIHSDTLSWTSLLAVGLALRARVLGTEEAVEELERVLRGLDHLARVSGEPGLLARTIVPYHPALEGVGEERRWLRGEGRHAGVDYRQRLWKNDNAKAQVQCWVLAMLVGLPEVRDAELRADLIEDVDAVCDRIVGADYQLTEIDGSPARFGDLHPASHGVARWFLGPIFACPIDLWPFGDLAVGPNALAGYSLALLHDRVAAEQGDRQRHAPRLAEDDWSEAIREGAYQVLGFHHYGNDFLATIGLWAMWAARPDEELLDDVRHVAGEIFSRHRHDQNALYGFLALGLGILDEDERRRVRREALFTLAVLPRDRTVHEHDRREDDWVDRSLLRRSRARHALPVNLQRSTSIFWNSDPSQLTGRSGAAGELENAGMDYLLAYWLARDLARRGLIEPLPDRYEDEGM